MTEFDYIKKNRRKHSMNPIILALLLLALNRDLCWSLLRKVPTALPNVTFSLQLQRSRSTFGFLFIEKTCPQVQLFFEPLNVSLLDFIRGTEQSFVGITTAPHGRDMKTVDDALWSLSESDCWSGSIVEVEGTPVYLISTASTNKSLLCNLKALMKGH